MTSITIIISGSKLFKNGGQLDNSTLKSQLLIPLVLIKKIRTVLEELDVEKMATSHAAPPPAISQRLGVDTE